MAVLLPEPESPVTTTRRRPSVILIWGPVQCSGASRPARFRCPQSNARAAAAARGSSALALGLPPQWASVGWLRRCGGLLDGDVFEERELIEVVACSNDHGGHLIVGQHVLQ